ncbi:MAG: hypothetical protein QNK04_08595 [Myxococcota bacterium]|nr:hypothetical protein [Myxococcota bacterium]
MRFALEYEVGWDQIEMAIAKRIAWDDAQPEDFRFEAEYLWPSGKGFRGVAIAEVGSVASLNALITHYGPTLEMRAHPASDVLSSIEQLRDESAHHE